MNREVFILSREEVEFMRNCVRHQDAITKKLFNEPKTWTVMEENRRADEIIEKLRRQMLKDKKCAGLSDQELLTLAAESIGIKIDKSRGNNGFDSKGKLVLDWHKHKTWNPLTDSDCAFALAAKLKLDVEFEDCIFQTSRRIVIAAALIEIDRRS